MKRLLLLLVCAAGACTKFEEPEVMKPKELAAEAEPKTRAGASTVFDTLPDPYALKNMQAVYDQYGIKNVLEATDVYVRFLPQNQEQLTLLEDVYGLALFDYPLDINIPDEEEYIDPTIPEGEIPWQYTTVKPDFVFPDDITCQVLYDCYIPEDVTMIETPGTRAGETIKVDLEQAAFERLGYDVGVGDTRSGGGGGFYSSGYVYVDNIKNPVPGVRVKVNSYTKIRFTTTGRNGYFRSDWKFWQENLKYTVVFINKIKDFIIWEGLGDRCKYKVTMHKSGGDINLSNGMPRKWAIVNNATWDYYDTCTVYGISLPPPDLKIWVMPKYSNSSASMIRRVPLSQIPLVSPEAISNDLFNALLGITNFVSGLFDWLGLKPDLTIGVKNNTDREIYEAVSHELAHASHFSQVGSEYWGKYISHIVQNWLDKHDTYGDGTEPFAGVCAVGEMWGYAMGHIRECDEYDYDRFDFTYNGNTYPIVNFYHPEWIIPHIIWDLNRNEILYYEEIYTCLTTDVDSVEKLGKKMLSMYPDSVAGLIRTFGAYGFDFSFTKDVTDEVITTDTTWSGTTINVRNVTVKNGAKLTLAANTINIIQPFTIDDKSGFEIKNL